jgi:hypothetical protein
MRRSFLLLACGAAIGVVLALTSGPVAADPTALCPTPTRAVAAQLADAAASDGKVLACCFEGTADAKCDIQSPNQTGCEWKLVYQCPDGKYSCDEDTKICSCDAASDGTTTTQ